MKKLILPLLFLLVMALGVYPAFATQPSADESLPIGLTAEEMTRLDEIGINHKATEPPSGVIRNPAEWEPSEGVLVRWPLGISVAIIAEMSENVMVTTICANQSQENSARSAYISGGVNMDNVQFIHAPTNTYWVRDYGPWFIFSDGNIGIVDPIYNRPRPDDDVIPQVIGEEWDIPVYGMDLIHTGGNHMSNGLGTSMSTRLVYDENPDKTETEVDSIMYAYLGNDYTVLDYVENWGIHHIDCWAKFLSPATILVKDVPQSDPSYTRLNERADFLSQQMSPWGRPYTVVRVYCPSGTAYTNSLILNDKVLVPIFNNSWDDEALQTYQDAMPGYEVIGFTGSWLDDDALHCRTMGVPDMQMLFIEHIPLKDQRSSTNDYLVEANIYAYSGESLIEDSLKIYYSVDDGLWQSSPLYSYPGPNAYYGYIPAQPSGSEVAYYLKAADYSGRVETHPFIGEPGAHRFNVLCTADISMTPDDNPVIVQPGGSFGFTGIIGNPCDTAITTDIWYGVMYQDNFYQQGYYDDITLTPGEYIQGHLTQNVPMYAPEDSYEYVAYCGERSDTIDDSAYFEFTVSGSSVPGGFSEWALEGNWIDMQNIPDTHNLIGCYPNPFNAATTIAYELPSDTKATLEIYNLRGQKVVTLIDGYQQAGKHNITWNAGNYSSGIYFYKLTAGNKTFTKRMTLLK